MLLRDLVEYAPAQEKAISNLEPRALSETRMYNWIDFRTHLWGNESFQEMRSVKEDGINSIRGVVAPDYHLVATVPGAMFPSWGLECQRILVRPEYNEAELEAVLVSQSARRVLVVTGPPGIGKSAFLVWLLMRRLSLRLPTVLQVSSSYVILFHEGGVSEFTRLDDLGLYYTLYSSPDHRSSRIWALVDSGPVLSEPAFIIKHNTPFFVVNTTSSCSDRSDWLYKIGHQYHRMRPWFALEIVRARPFLGYLEEDQLRIMRGESCSSPVLSEDEESSSSDESSD